MKDIHEVLRRKQAKYAQLAKQIEALQQAAEKLREVAPLLADAEDEDSLLLTDAEEETPAPAAPKAASAAAPSPAVPPKRGVAPRWP